MAIISVLLAVSCSHGSGEPNVQINPQPKQIFHLFASIKNAPGPFDSVEATASYEVENWPCVPLAPVSGARNVPHHTLSLPVTRVGDVYQATFATDALIDGDYFGRGICHWHLTSAGVSIRHKNRKFDASVTPPSDGRETSTAPYFSIESYEDTAEALIDTGLRDRSELTQPDNAFQIQLNARKATP
jgi:hypothetical protein